MLDPDLKAAITLDDSQMEQLIGAHWNDIWIFTYMMTRRRDVADDLTQETFIRAFRALSSFQGKASFRTWLLKIARNLAINYARSAFIRKVTLVSWAGSFSPGVAPSAESEFMVRESVTEIWGYVLRLPAKLRETLLLEARYGFTLKEIADILEIPEGTVKSRLNRARKRMIKWLKGEEIHE
jgi:RNA polymerase sigma-70 factor (ECF subfamily)